MISTILLGVLLTLTFLLFDALRKRFQYFKEKGIKHLKPLFFFGNSAETLFGRSHGSKQIEKVYAAFPEEDLVGHYELFAPHVVVRNPTIVNEVLTKDFSFFHDRVKTAKGAVDGPADANLFVLPGNTWRTIRNKFSPLFSSGKQKAQYNTVDNVSKNLVKALDEKESQDVEMSDVMSLFAMDVIGATGFGIEPTLLQNPDTEFSKNGKKMFDGSLPVYLKNFLAFNFPQISKMMGLNPGFSKETVLQYFYDVIGETIKQREESGIVRNDFVQMMINLKKQGSVKVPLNDKEFEVEMSDDLLVGSTYTYLLFGFHASAMTLTYALYELSQNPELVERLREEIKNNVSGEDATHDELKNMPLLDKVLKETMRLHPTARTLLRTCGKDYTFSNGTQISAGQSVIIPVSALQKDPQYWDSPEEFNPDRWDSQPKTGTYLPFGDGPRICTGQRFAQMEMKSALAKLVSRYNFQLSEKTQLPLEIDPRTFLAAPKNGITFNLQRNPIAA